MAACPWRGPGGSAHSQALEASASLRPRGGTAFPAEVILGGPAWGLRFGTPSGGASTPSSTATLGVWREKVEHVPQPGLLLGDAVRVPGAPGWPPHRQHRPCCGLYTVMPVALPAASSCPHPSAPLPQRHLPGSLVPVSHPCRLASGPPTSALGAPGCPSSASLTSFCLPHTC